MHKQRFEVEFLDDIVLNSSSATTMGLSDTLDYIIHMNCRYYFEYLPLHEIGLPIPNEN